MDPSTAPADPAEVLQQLLAQHPDARVSATSPEGMPVEVPPAVGLRPSHSRGSRAGVRTWAAEDRSAVIAAFELARRTGIGTVSARLASDPTATYALHLLDLRPAYGVLLTVAVGQSGADGTRRLVEADQVSEGPRLARVTKSDVGVFLTIDAATTTILGWRPEEMVGHRSLEFIHPDDHALALENWFELLGAPGPSRRVRLRHRSRSGAWVWFEVSNTNLLQQDDPCVVAEMVDISKEMAAQELLVRLTQALPLGVFQVDAARRIVYSNSRLLDMLALTHASSLDQLLSLAVPADEQALEDAVAAVLQRSTDRDIEVELAIPGRSEGRHYQLNLRPLTKQHGDSNGGAIGCLADVTDSVVLRRGLEVRASFDTLTGCHNRESVTAALQALTRAADSHRTGIGVFFIDLDHFKAVNDTLGHAAGDELLSLVADRLRALTREHDLLGRLGGDEFLIVCPQLADANAALVLGRRIADTLHGDVALAAGTVALGASIGVAWTISGQLDETVLVNRADAAMYAAKRRRDGVPCLYAPGLDAAPRHDAGAAQVPAARATEAPSPFGSPAR